MSNCVGIQLLAGVNCHHLEVNYDGSSLVEAAQINTVVVVEFS